MFRFCQWDDSNMHPSVALRTHHDVSPHPFGEDFVAAAAAGNKLTDLLNGGHYVTPVLSNAANAFSAWVFHQTTHCT